MARKYSKAASKKVASAIKKAEAGKLKSGGSGATVKSRKQAIAIGLSEARAEGKKVPKAPKKKAAKKTAKTTVNKTTVKKTAKKKSKKAKAKKAKR